MDFRLVLGWVKHVLLARLLPFWQRNLVMSWGRLSWRFQVYWRKACQPACLPASIWHFLLIFQQLSRPPSCAFLATRFYCLIRKVALGPGDLPTATGPLRQDALRSKNVQSFVHALSRLKIAAAFYCSPPCCHERHARGVPKGFR